MFMFADQVKIISKGIHFHGSQIQTQYICGQPNAKTKQIKSCLSAKLTRLPDCLGAAKVTSRHLDADRHSHFPSPLLYLFFDLGSLCTPLSAELIQASGQLFALLCMSFPYHCAGSSVSCKCSPKLGGKVNLAWPKALLDDGLSAIVLHASGATKPCDLPRLPITRRCCSEVIEKKGDMPEDKHQIQCLAPMGKTA